jgi:hypothetical protein
MFGTNRPVVRITRQYLHQRGKTSVTLTREELHHLGRLMKAGRILLNDTQPVSPRLRAAMTKLGVDTSGL